MIIRYKYSNSAKKFFDKHQEIKNQFKANIIKHLNGERIDIKNLQGYNDLLRIRIGKYRIVFLVKKDEISIINVLAAGSRGDVYKHINK